MSSVTVHPYNDPEHGPAGSPVTYEADAVIHGDEPWQPTLIAANYNPETRKGRTVAIWAPGTWTRIDLETDQPQDGAGYCAQSDGDYADPYDCGDTCPAEGEAGEVQTAAGPGTIVINLTLPQVTR